jgi:hypothetical protein
MHARRRAQAAIYFTSSGLSPSRSISRRSFAVASGMGSPLAYLWEVFSEMPSHSAASYCDVLARAAGWSCETGQRSLTRHCAGAAPPLSLGGCHRALANRWPPHGQCNEMPCTQP